MKNAYDKYPNKAGNIELHHITPKYLGGSPSGPLIPLDGAYHQLITKAFRRLWGYGKGDVKSEKLEEIMNNVYSQYPLPLK